MGSTNQDLRITDPAWRNFDPWECCGQDKYCDHDSRKPGGCHNGCIVPKLYKRLAQYEDIGKLNEFVKIVHCGDCPRAAPTDNKEIIYCNRHETYFTIRFFCKIGIYAKDGEGE